jgi:GNAT superfamily N-acetyltransferase
MNVIPKKPPAVKKAALPWKLEHELSLAHSKAFVFVLEEFTKLVQAGHADFEIPFTNASQVTYTIVNGEVAGASVWTIDKAKRSAWMLFSAVAKAHQRKGIYTALSAEVERRAKNQGAVVIYSGVHIDNDAMVNAAVKAGRQANWYRTKKKL